MTIHTDFRQGQRIRLMPKDGGPHMVGSFVESGSGFISVDFRGDGNAGVRAKIYLKDLRSVTIDRAPVQRRQSP